MRMQSSYSKVEGDLAQKLPSRYLEDPPGGYSRLDTEDVAEDKTDNNQKSVANCVLIVTVLSHCSVRASC